MKSSQVALLVAGIAAVSLLVSPVEAQRDRNTVIIGMSQEPDTLGIFSVMVAARLIENALLARIAVTNDKWVNVPVMAEKLPTVQDGDWVVLPNGKMKVTWKLKRGFTWHDGKPVTALDWRFTYGMKIGRAHV